MKCTPDTDHKEDDKPADDIHNEMRKKLIEVAEKIKTEIVIKQMHR